MTRFAVSALLICCIAQAAKANEWEASMRGFVEEHVAHWASDPILIDAIHSQNSTTRLLPQSTITALDTEWQTQAGTVCGGMLLDVLAHPASHFLRTQKAVTDGAITEVLLMDARGLTVAATRMTSDYWQGDEAKYTATYLVGPDTMHFGEIERDASTETVQGQVSMTITDDETGEPIGALTIGIDLTALM